MGQWQEHDEQQHKATCRQGISLTAPQCGRNRFKSRACLSARLLILTNQQPATSCNYCSCLSTYVVQDPPHLAVWPNAARCPVRYALHMKHLTVRLLLLRYIVRGCCVPAAVTSNCAAVSANSLACKEDIKQHGAAGWQGHLQHKDSDNNTNNAHAGQHKQAHIHAGRHDKVGWLTAKCKLRSSSLC